MTRLTPPLRLAIVLLAVALAYAAQLLFDYVNGTGRFMADWFAVLPAPLAVASATLLLAMILFALAAPPPAKEQRRLLNWQPLLRSPSSSPSNPALSLAPTSLFLLALVLYLLALGLYLDLGESSAVRLLWAGSMLALLASQARPREMGQQLARALSRWRPLVLPASLLLLALGLRLVQLTAIPQDLHGDMASHGLQARALLQSGLQNLIGTGWADIPLIGFLPTATVMALVSNDGLLGLNLTSVIGGVFSLWGLYVLVSQLWGRRVALIALTLLAVSCTHIHFSRIAEYMDPVPLAVWGLVGLNAGLRSGRNLTLVLAGMLLGLGGLMYFSGRAVVVIAGLVLAHHLLLELLNRRPGESPGRPWQDTGRALGLLLLGLLVVLGPYTLFFVQEPIAFLSRSQAVVLSNPEVLTHLQGKYGVEGFWPVLWEQVKRSLLMFNFYHDSSTQFGLARPMVDSLTGPWVALGFAYAIAHWRQRGTGILAIFLGSVLVMGSILTNNAPFWPRLVVILLPATALAGVALDRAWATVSAGLGADWDSIVRILVVGGLVYLGLQNWLIYYPVAAHNGRPRALVGRFIGSLPLTTTVCLVPEDPDRPDAWIHSLGEREIAFFQPPRAGFEVSLDQLLASAGGPDANLPSRCLEPGAAWIVPQSRQPALAWLESRFPGGQAEAYGRTATDLVFHAYRVP